MTKLARYVTQSSEENKPTHPIIETVWKKKLSIKHIINSVVTSINHKMLWPILKCISYNIKQNECIQLLSSTELVNAHNVIPWKTRGKKVP